MKLQRGRKAVESPPVITDVRPLARADLAHLTERREPKTIQTLRDNHHRIARAVAGGMSNAEVAATCGISIGRVNTLKADPSFEELVAHYRSVLTTEWAQADTVIEFMRSNALKAQAMLSDKLDDASEKGEYLPTRDLLGIAELGLDRTGYGKVNKNVNINVDFASKLEAARQRADRAREVRQVEGTAVPLSPAESRPEGESQPVAPQRSVSPAPPRALRRL